MIKSKPHILGLNESQDRKITPPISPILRGRLHEGHTELKPV